MSKNILITGANGALATGIIAELLNSPNTNLFLFSRNKHKLAEKYNFVDQINIYDYSDLSNFNYPIDILLHCAFERSSDTAELYKSILLSKDIFQQAKTLNCKKVINVSSQAVYNCVAAKSWTEDDMPNPSDFYGLAKVSTEILLDSMITKNNYINIRLTALSGKHYRTHLLYKMLKVAVETKEITIVGGQQNFAFMDYRDAVRALLLVLNSKDFKYHTYNLGNNQQYNILDIAECIKLIMHSYGYNIKINIQPNDNIKLNVSLDSSKFMTDFNWNACYSLEDTVRNIYLTCFGYL